MTDCMQIYYLATEAYFPIGLAPLRHLTSIPEYTRVCKLSPSSLRPNSFRNHLAHLTMRSSAILYLLSLATGIVATPVPTYAKLEERAAPKIEKELPNPNQVARDLVVSLRHAPDITVESNNPTVINALGRRDFAAHLIIGPQEDTI
jgi:hypothetical protein